MSQAINVSAFTCGENHVAIASDGRVASGSKMYMPLIDTLKQGTMKEKNVNLTYSTITLKPVGGGNNITLYDIWDIDGYHMDFIKDIDKGKPKAVRCKNDDINAVPPMPPLIPSTPQHKNKSKESVDDLFKDLSGK